MPARYRIATLLAIVTMVFSAFAPVHAAEGSRDSFRVCWSIYAGWMPWAYADKAGIVDKWADKYDIDIEVVQINDYIESVNQYTSGNMDGCAMTNMDALTIPAASGVDSTALLINDYSDGNDGIVLKGSDDLADIEGRRTLILMGLVLAWLIPQLTQGFWPERPAFIRSWRLPLYLVRVLLDIVVASFSVARLILSPRKPQPMFVCYPLDLEHPLAISILASTISLTPGTVSADVSDDNKVLLIHALDAQSEQEVIDAIKAADGLAIVVIVAHRLGTVRHCDLIVELSDGRVTAFGTYEELMETSPSFRFAAGSGETGWSTRQKGVDRERFGDGDPR